MANISSEREVIVGLVHQAVQDPGLRDRPRFDPTVVTHLVGGLQSSEDGGPVFLRRTSSLHIPGTYTEVTDDGLKTERRKAIGHKTVALFAEVGPAISRETTEDIIHHGSDLGVWLRRPTETELSTLGEDGRSRHALVFELVVPLPGSPDTVVPMGVASEPYVPGSL